MKPRVVLLVASFSAAASLGGVPAAQASGSLVVAAGDSPRHLQYANEVGEEVAPGTAGAEEQGGVEAEVASGSLPFTGLQIALVVLAGGLVGGMGLRLRRLGRPDRN